MTFIKYKSLFERHPVKSMTLFLFSIFLLLLVLLEIALRVSGTSPGCRYANTIYYNVDSLYHYKEYTADENGILKVSDHARKTVAEWVQPDRTPSKKELSSLRIDFTIQQVILDQKQTQASTNYDTDFNRMIQQVKEKKPSSLTPADSLYLHYAQYPINTDGFRSIEFTPIETEQKTVLLLGDSFTWGYAAEPIYNSFPDLLSAKGCIVYNTGITAADLAQYEFLAQKYIPLVQPDFLVVNFYMGNDIAWWERELVPYQFLQYNTNAGWLSGNPRKEYFKDVQTAYEFVKSDIGIPNQASNWVNRFLAATAIGTKCWLLLDKWGWVDNKDLAFKDYLERNKDIWSPTPIAESYIERMEAVCNQYGAQLVLAIIPDIANTNPYNKEIPPDSLFKKIPFYIPNELSEQDYYPKPNGHFNNEGHRKYADFLFNLIETTNEP